jgi:hypothetical protein
MTRQQIGWLGIAVLACWFWMPPLSAQTQPGPIVSTPGSAPVAAPSVPSQTAVAVTEVKSPAAPAHYADQALWALMVSFLIEYLKKTKWFGWITPQSTARLKAQFGFIAALLTAAGIHFAVSGNLFGDGATVTISGISANAVKDVLWQWAAQQGWYKLLVKDRETVIVTAAPVGGG